MGILISESAHEPNFWVQYSMFMITAFAILSFSIVSRDEHICIWFMLVEKILVQFLRGISGETSMLVARLATILDNVSDQIERLFNSGGASPEGIREWVDRFFRYVIEKLSVRCLAKQEVSKQAISIANETPVLVISGTEKDRPFFSVPDMTST